MSFVRSTGRDAHRIHMVCTQRRCIAAANTCSSPSQICTAIDEHSLTKFFEELMVKAHADPN
jgi:hypothetical protein